MNLSLPHMRTRTLCAVSKSTDSLNNDGRQHCLWGFDFHHTAHMNKSFKAALPSLLFHLRVQKKLKLLGACPVWWTMNPSISAQIRLTVQHQYHLLLSQTYVNLSTWSLAENPAISKAVRKLLLMTVQWRQYNCKWLEKYCGGKLW